VICNIHVLFKAQNSNSIPVLSSCKTPYGASNMCVVMLWLWSVFYFLCFNATYSNISATWALEEVEVIYRIKYMYINNTSFSKIILDGLSAHNVLML
jgi:hypothetical protein